MMKQVYRPYMQREISGHLLHTSVSSWVSSFPYHTVYQSISALYGKIVRPTKNV